MENPLEFGKHKAVVAPGFFFFPLVLAWHGYFLALGFTDSGTVSHAKQFCFITITCFPYPHLPQKERKKAKYFEKIRGWKEDTGKKGKAHRYLK